MKRKLLSIASILMAVVTLSFFSSCKDEEPQHKPELKLTSSQLVDGVFNVSAQTGQYEIAYAVEYAVEGAAVSAESAVDWIEITETVIGSPVDGKIIFKVAENTAAARDGKITVSYPDADAQIVTVKQAAAGENPEKPENPDDPDKDTNEHFEVTIGNETMNSVEVAVIPVDKELPYFMFVNTEEYFIEHGLMEDDAAVVADDLAFLKKDAEMYDETLDQTFGYYVHTGDFGGPVQSLMPATRYVIYLYGAALDGENLVNTTPVYRYIAETRDYEKHDVSFSFDFNIDGPIVDMSVNCLDYDGYFYFDVLEGVTDLEEAQGLGVSLWMQLVDFYSMFGYEMDAILNEAAQKESGSYVYELKGETEYMGFALALNDKGEPYSKVSGEVFKTGEIEMSDNEITIEVKNIQSHQVDVSFYPTNEDPYTAVLYEADRLEGMTDDEIIAACIEGEPNPVTGEKHVTIPNLKPSMNYAVLVFGMVAGTPTTSLFREDFTTLEEVEGTATISITWDEYYDIEAVGELQPDFLDYLASGDFFLPLNVTTDPVDAEVYYYCAYSEEALEEHGLPNTDEALIEDMMSYGPAVARDDAYILSYGEHNFVVGLVADANGNLSKLWRSEVFVLEKEGASDPQGFLDRYGAPARPAIHVPFSLELQVADPIEVFTDVPVKEVKEVQGTQPKYKELDLNRVRSKFVR